jgi:uncharacterized Zn-finger protein
MYSCKRCGFTTKYKVVLKNHFERKIQCEPIKEDVEISELVLEIFPNEEKQFSCSYCEKSFTLSSNMYRHQKQCRNNYFIKCQNVIEENAKLTETNNKLNLENEKLKINKTFDTCENLIYIVQLREHVNIKENVYKIGRTNGSINKRMKGYPKGSIIITTFKCKSSNVEMEKQLKKVFSCFKCRTDIGSEYFECDYYKMIQAFNKVCEQDLI